MEKNKYLCLLTVLVSIFAGGSAYADAYYLSVNSGASRLKDHCTNLAAGFSCKDTSPAISLEGGYQFNDTFGLELGLGYYGAPVTSGMVNGSNLEVTQTLFGAKLSGTASYAVTKSFAVNAKLGISDTFLNVTSTVTPGPAIEPYNSNTLSPLYAIGLKYKLNRSLALQAQYEYLGKIGDDITGTDTLSMISAGIYYIFGNAENARSKPAKDNNRPAEKTGMRIAVFLEHNVPKNKLALTNAVAQACQCDPIYIGFKNKNEAFYQIYLASDNDFSSFRLSLLNADPRLGIKVIMQDK